jgi:hypothetical protein
MEWSKSMLVIEPSARVTAQALFSSIANFGKRGKKKASENRFCGECCAREHEEESSSESVSDDDVWGGDFGDITTPATSPPATDPALRPREPSLTPHELRRITLSVPIVSARLESLAVSEAESNTGTVGCEENATLVGAAQPPMVQPLEFLHVRAVSLQSNSNLGTQKVADEQDEVSIQPLENSTHAIKDASTDPEVFHKAKTPASIVKDETSSDQKVRIRQEPVQAATSKNQIWPFTDLQGRLPTIVAEDWKSHLYFSTPYEQTSLSWSI